MNLINQTPTKIKNLLVILSFRYLNSFKLSTMATPRTTPSSKNFGIRRTWQQRLQLQREFHCPRHLAPRDVAGDGAKTKKASSCHHWRPKHLVTSAWAAKIYCISCFCCDPLPHDCLRNTNSNMQTKKMEATKPNCLPIPQQPMETYSQPKALATTFPPLSPRICSFLLETLGISA